MLWLQSQSKEKRTLLQMVFQDKKYQNTIILCTQANVLCALSSLKRDKSIFRNLESNYKKYLEFNEHYEKPIRPFELRDGMLYLNDKVRVISGRIRKKLLHYYYSTPNTVHLGETKTCNRMKDLCY